jgi:2-methylfumaryl-CoA isomerase
MEACELAGAPLGGLTVLEISSFVAGPLGGMTLAQLGAEVIRIDPVGGGPDFRRWPLAPSGTSLYWTALNKGKRSVALNLRAAEGQRLLGELLTASGSGGGIVLTNAVGRGLLSRGELAKLRPDLIHLQIQGHRDGRAAVDYTVNAETGFPLITGPEGIGGPVNHVLPAWDVACGLYAAVGLFAALGRAARSRSRWATWRWLSPGTSASWQRRRSAERIARGSGTTFTAVSPATSAPPTESASWWSH